MSEFNPKTQRKVRGPNGIEVVDIDPRLFLIPLIEPTDAEMERNTPFETRIIRAKELADEGVIVDLQTDVWGWGIENTNRLRKMFGYKEVPAAFNPGYFIQVY